MREALLKPYFRVCRVKSDAPHASWNNIKERGGLGWVVHDTVGSSIYVGMLQIKEEWSIKALETKAILKGFRSLPSLGLMHVVDPKPKIMVESDATSMIELLIGEEEDLTKIKKKTWWRKFTKFLSRSVLSRLLYVQELATEQHIA